jgi:hypothetical protein
MSFNNNHPSFLLFLDKVTSNILSQITIDNYFNLPQDKKMGVLYVVFKYIRNSIKIGGKVTDKEMKTFIQFLWKKNEENENYEFAAVLKDITNNFDSINEFVKPKQKVGKPHIKIEKKE